MEMNGGFKNDMKGSLDIFVHAAQRMAMARSKEGVGVLCKDGGGWDLATR